MSHHGGAAVIVHADDFIFCFISRTVVSVLETTCRLPVKNINLMFFTAMGIASSATPIFFLRKRNKKAEGRKDGENEWFGHGGAWGTNCAVNWHKKQLKLWVVQLRGPQPWNAPMGKAAEKVFSQDVNASGVNAFTGRTK